MKPREKVAYLGSLRIPTDEPQRLQRQTEHIFFVAVHLELQPRRRPFRHSHFHYLRAHSYRASQQ